MGEVSDFFGGLGDFAVDAGAATEQGDDEDGPPDTVTPLIRGCPISKAYRSERNPVCVQPPHMKARCVPIRAIAWPVRAEGCPSLNLGADHHPVSTSKR